MRTTLISITFFIFFINEKVACQDLTDQIKSFNSFSLDYGLSKKTDISFYYTSIAEFENYKINFNDIGINIKQSINKKSTLTGGLDFISIRQRNTTNFSKYKKLSLEYALRSRFHKFNVSNELEGEVYIPKFNKFKYRWIYSLDLTYRLNAGKWKIRPFSKFKIYYYSGGNFLDYYDDDGNLAARKAPNDIHRWRWYGGIKFRPFKQTTAVVSFFWNEEFNAGLSRYGNINIYNKDRDGIRYPFNSYGAVSLYLSYTIKIKKQKPSEEETKEDEKEIEIKN